MTVLCTSSNTGQTQPEKYRCPVNGRSYSGVSSTTILHHLNEPWNWRNKEQGYYFCKDPECDVVYFGQDGSVLNKTALRTTVGIKEKTPESLVCYCFGVTKEASGKQQIKEFVIKSTKENTCACSTRNPSGRCCSKDFP